jgi:hypothetical protein
MSGAGSNCASVSFFIPWRRKTALSSARFFPWRYPAVSRLMSRMRTIRQKLNYLKRQQRPVCLYVRADAPVKTFRMF